MSKLLTQSKDPAHSAQVELNRRKAIKSAKQILGNWQLYAMVLPAVLSILIFNYVPMYGIQIAFREFKFRGGITGSEWVGFKQFLDLFESSWFPIALKNTLTISFLNVAINFPIPIIFALLANELRNEKVKRTLQTVSYAPHFISTVVICGMVVMFVQPETGIINLLIEKFGGKSVGFLSDPDLYKWVHILSGTWAGTGWSAVIYFAALSAVDKSLLEAAEIDGASRFQRILHINLPTILPTVVIQLILAVGRVMSLGYEKVLLLQNDLNVFGSETLSVYVYKVGMLDRSYSFSTAASIFNSVCNCILLISVNKLSKWLTKESMW